jgi:branched-chain amino acid transport system substrate-binding protein
MIAGLIAGAAALLLMLSAAIAQTPSGKPITIGFSMALTGSLAVNGKSGLLASQIWEEDINAKGGLLGRPVKLIFYDDQTNPSLVPGITQSCSTSTRSTWCCRDTAPTSRRRRCRSSLPRR